MTGMPARDCTAIVHEGDDGAWFLIAVETSERCAPEAEMRTHARFAVNRHDGRVKRADFESGIVALAPGGISLAEGRYSDVPDRPIAITDIVSWSHPVTAVFSGLGVELHRAVLTELATYATFEVSLRQLRNVDEDRLWVRDLWNRVCSANYGFSFAATDRRSNTRTTVECAGDTAVGGEGLGW